METKQNNNKSYIYSDNYFDFADLFNLVKAESYGHDDKDIFDELTSTIYENALIQVEYKKDLVSRIKNRKTNFTKELVNNTSLNELNIVAHQYESPLLSSYVLHPNVLSDKILYLVKNESIYFNQEDIDQLMAFDNDSSKILAYVTIKTILYSLDSFKYRHTENYDPFKLYVAPKDLTTNTSSPSERSIKESIRKLSLYQLNNFAPFNSEKYNSDILSKGYELFSSKVLSSDISQLNPKVTDLSKSESEKDNTIKLDKLFDSKKNILIIGEGGIGKTTFLYGFLKNHHEQNANNSIPIYIKLSDCSLYNDHRYMITEEIIKKMNQCLNGPIRYSYKDIIDEFSRPSNHPEYTLLLDGFNEITPLDWGNIRNSIAKEINTFIEMTNIQIIVTTRETGLYALSEESFQIYKANGIDEDTIKNYLDSKYDEATANQIKHNKSLLECLKIPLFLVMFKNTYYETDTLPKDRGSILYNFYNSRRSIYSEKINADDKTEQELCLLIYILLDFILPDIGFYMETQDLFSISYDEYDYIFDNCIPKIDDFIDLNEPLFNQYKNSISLKKARKLITQYDSDDFLAIAKDCLEVLTQGSDNRIYFSHQYIRDYFSSYFFLRSIYYSTKTDKNHDILFNHFPTDIISGETIMDSTQIIMAEEILPSFIRDHNSIQLLEKAINICRYPKKPSSYIATRYILPNIIRILSDLNEYDLSEMDFTNLDFFSCNLSNINFYNPINNKNALFDGSSFYYSTFSEYEHHSPLLKYSLTNNKKNIISMSTDGEVKLWDISTKKCLFTIQIDYSDIMNYGPNKDKVSHIYDIGYVEYKTDHFIWIAFYDNSENDISVKGCITYNLSYDLQTEYYIPDTYETSDIFLHFGYDEITNRLYGITKNRRLYYYNVDNSSPVNCTILTKSFIEEIKNYYDTKDQVLRFSYELKNQINFISDNILLFSKAKSIRDIIKDSKGNDITIMRSVSTITEIKYVEIYTYDIKNKKLTQITIEKPITTDEMEESYNNEIKSHPVISPNKQYIITSADTDIYMYDISKNDYTFKKIFTIYERTPYCISFLKNSNNTICVYYYNTVLHVDINTGIILYKNHIEHWGYCFNYHFSDKYLIAEHASYALTHEKIHYSKTNSTGIFSITNIYTKSTASLALSSNRMIINLAYYNNKVYCLFRNGTVISLSAKDLSVISSYNYCPNRHIIASAYDSKTNSFCIVSSQYHEFLSSDEIKISRIDLSSLKYIENTFYIPSNYYKISFVLESKYMALYSSNEAFLINYDNLIEMYSTEPNIGHMEITDQIIDNNDSFILINTFIYDGKEIGTIKEYTITNNALKILNIYTLPIDTINDYAIPLYKKLLNNSGVVLFKSIKKTRNKITYSPYNYHKNDENYNSISLVKEASKLNIGYFASEDLKVPSTDSLTTPVAENIYVFNDMNDIYYLCKINSCNYLYNSLTNVKIKIDNTLDLENAVYNSDMNLIYYTDDSFYVYAYDVNSSKIICISPELKPAALLQNCSLNNCKGVEYLPEYYL